ncbi:MAG: GSU2403 family nucleotidyltransferase fold protein [Pseudomonadota bacterium]|nr:GSU2403 family nucleotidyltransferase fold protein [Pseudomonadota bacterium]
MNATRYHSQVGISAYRDLLRMLQDDAASDLRGTPGPVTVRGRTFWYDKYRVGNQMRQRYIGPDTPELRQRLDRLDELKAQREARRRERTRLIRILRAEGYGSTDRKTGSLLSAFSAGGVFRLGGTLVGTVAFRHYEGELGVAPGFDHLASTDDLDIASFERLSFAVDDAVETPLAAVFSELRFDPVPSLDGHRTWRWAQSDGGTLVEFLMPAMRDEGVRDLPALGVSAMALRHLDYLLEDPVPAVSLYRSGVLVSIPRPERYAIHKLVVAERRLGGPDAFKARKDRAQAAFLISVLAELRPDELRDAYEDAVRRGPRWKSRIAASLDRLPDSRALLRGTGA